MRRSSLQLTLLLAFQQSIAGQAIPKPAEPPVRTFAQIPGEVKQAVPALNGQRIYYVNGAGELWLYDVAKKRSAKVTAEPILPVSAIGHYPVFSVSRRGDLLAYPHAGYDQHWAPIWTVPLDSITGLATGPARRASVSTGFYPAISPDGKWIAFVDGADQGRLVVMPSTGGTERTAVRVPVRTPPRYPTDTIGISHPMWSADGTELYYVSVSDSAKLNGSIFRVPVVGGKPVALATVDDAGVVQSPDGKLLMFDADDEQTAIIDGTGRRVAGSKTYWNGGAEWLSQSEVFRWSSDQPHLTLALTLADGAKRVVLPDSVDGRRQALSPNGKLIAALGDIGPERRGPHSTLIVANADGSHRRVIPLPGGGANLITWSPDGQRVVVELDSEFVYSLVAVDLANSSAERLRSTDDILGGNAMRWTGDSRRVLYLTYSKTRGTTLHSTGMDSTDVLVRNMNLPGRPSTMRFLSDTTVLLTSDSTTFVRSLTSERTVIISRGAAQGVTGVSPDGSLLAVSRPGVRGVAASWSIADIFTLTGVHVTSVQFSNSIWGGFVGHYVLTPDNKHLIVSTENGTAGCCALYEAALDGYAPRKIGELRWNNPPPALLLSPDGKTLYYTDGGAFVTTFQATDISSILHPPRKP